MSALVGMAAAAVPMGGLLQDNSSSVHESSASAAPKPWYRRVITTIGYYVLHYTYFLTYIMIYVASLVDVNFLNAGYIFLLIVGVCSGFCRH
jgi:hypothetical protein